MRVHRTVTEVWPQQRRTTKEAAHRSLICFHMRNWAERFFLLLKQTEHAPSSRLWFSLLCRPICRLTADKYIAGLFLVWRILSSSQDRSKSQCEALAKPWDYEAQNIICTCFCNRIGCWKTDWILIRSTANLSWPPPAWSGSGREGDPGLRVPELEPD